MSVFKIKADLFNGEVILICTTEAEAVQVEKECPEAVVYSPEEIAFLKMQDYEEAMWLHEAKKQFPRSKILLDAGKLKPNKKLTLREQLKMRNQGGA